MDKHKIKIIILAAGKGKRMQSESPKVLAKVKGRAMVSHLLDRIRQAKVCKKACLIVGYGKEKVIEELGDRNEYAVQAEQLGTGHAVSCAREKCKGAKHILVLYGDMPFISADTIKNLIKKHLDSSAKITLTVAIVPDFEDWRKSFTCFGRVLREDGKISGIREYKHAFLEEKKIKEVNAGCCIFEANWLWNNLTKIKNGNTQEEYYLTNLIKIAVDQGEKVESIQIDPSEALGANTKEELEILEKFAFRNS